MTQPHLSYLILSVVKLTSADLNRLTCKTCNIE